MSPTATPAPGLLLGHELPDTFTDLTLWLKRLFDLGFIGFVVNVVVFVAVSTLTKSLPPERVREFAELMKSRKTK